MNKYNINNEVIIYPTERGFKKIKHKLIEIYGEELGALEFNRKLTETNGFKEQLWCIMQDHSNLFYNGTDCLKTMVIELLDE